MSDGPNWRLLAYRAFMRSLGARALKSAVSARRWDEGRTHSSDALQAFEGAQAKSRRAWFHASSVGELESIWPVILLWAEGGGEVVVTIFSESVRGHLEKLRAALAERAPGKAVFLGYAPWEGDWETALRRARPEIFVTAKYEAWPDLWASLARLGIPLAIVGARPRRSLRRCAEIVRALGLRLPELRLLAATEPDAEGLRREFPAAWVEVTGEPRWDQVKARAVRGNPRARELMEQFKASPRPWGILAQVWLSDLEAWDRYLAGLPGTVWVVPHRVDAENIGLIDGFLKARGISALKTSGLLASSMEASSKFLLVDEMGFLLELYSQASWAFVGGGFGKISMHSTIEPAIHGLPIAVGPRGQERFPEISELKATGELTVLETPGALEAWIRKHVDSGESTAALQANWRRENESRLGASERVLNCLGSEAVLGLRTTSGERP